MSSRFATVQTGVDQILDFSSEDTISLFGTENGVSFDNFSQSGFEVTSGSATIQVDFAVPFDTMPSATDFDVYFVDDHYVVALMNASV